jgi:hypothetical protein
MLAPVGVNRLPEVAITKDTLAQHGWREIKVGTKKKTQRIILSACHSSVFTR